MTEDQLEQEALGWLQDVGYTHSYGPDIAPDGPAPERENYRQVVLVGRLRSAIARLNPAVPASAQEDACLRRLNFDPPCRFNIDPGRIVAF
jgi:type I restriction enzyme R subunit